MNSVDLKRERSKQKLTLLLMVLSYLPFLLFATVPSGNVDSIITYAASQTGYMAAMLFLWQFILGTRSVSGLIHKDLVWVTKWHKNLAIYGIALVVLHPLLVAYSYSEDLLFLFFGALETDFDRHVAFGRMAFMLFLLVWFTSAVVRAKIGYRPWKYIHYLTYVIFPLVLLHAPGVGSFYRGDEAFRTAWQVMIGVYVALVALRLRHFFTFGQRPYKLTNKREGAPGIFMYQLEPMGKKLKPAPGQFVYLRRSFMSEEHPFSVAGYSEESGQITIAAKVFGKYTKKLSELEKGTTVYLDGPYGVFTQEIALDPRQPSTLIAGGIGVTPFIQHALNNKSDNLTLFNANRAPENVVIHGLLKKAMGDRYVDVYSDVDEPGAEKGRVDVELLKKHLDDNFEKQMFYICGPPPMMAGVKRELLKAGIPAKRIHTEEFNF